MPRVDPALARAVAARGVTRVCHLTQARSFAQIVSSPDGVLATAALREEHEDVLNQNDPLRLDQKDTHISCSIEYPNTHYLKKVAQRERVFEDWVILFIDPVVLTWGSTVFAPCNAAACVDRHATGAAGFEALYEAEIVGGGGRRWRRTAARLAPCPTDDQAEVLVERTIPRALLRAVAVRSEAQLALERSRLRFVSGAVDLPWVVAPALFDGTWTGEIRTGRRPPERVVAAGVDGGAPGGGPPGA